jgi:hypothetical protein
VFTTFEYPSHLERSALRPPASTYKHKWETHEEVVQLVIYKDIEALGASFGLALQQVMRDKVTLKGSATRYHASQTPS